jgi:hypothetical protein
MKHPFVLCTALITSVFLGTVFITGSGISCQSQSPVSQSPTQGPTETTVSAKPTLPPSESWSADGIIGSQEYVSEATYGDYEIHWVNDQKYIYMAIKAKTTGWVSVGIQPGLGMKDADMIFGFVKDGVVTILDSYGTNIGFHPDDTELGGTFDIISFGGQEAGGYTTIEFKRALDTGDKYDKALATGNNRIIWAYGPDDTPTTKHTQQGQGEITITG